MNCTSSQCILIVEKNTIFEQEARSEALYVQHITPAPTCFICYSMRCVYLSNRVLQVFCFCFWFTYILYALILNEWKVLWRFRCFLLKSKINRLPCFRPKLWFSRNKIIVTMFKNFYNRWYSLYGPLCASQQLHP